MNRQLFDTMVTQYKKQTVTGTDSVVWSDGAHCYLPSLKFYGACRQYPTPTPDNPVDIWDHIGVYKVNSENDYIALPNLRGIGDYKDEWDYVTGKGVRRVASVTLDGVSDNKKVSGFGLATKTGYYYGSINIEHKSHHAQFGLLLSSHFRPEWTFTPGTAYVSGSGSYESRNILMYHTDQTLDTVKKWNAWLKAQYDAGTPVIFYYALAEPQPFEERVQPYKPIPNDSGRISFVDGNVSDVPFEATYITHS